MSLITLNYKDKNAHSFNNRDVEKKIFYGSRGVPLNTPSLQDSVKLNNRNNGPLKEHSVKTQIAFKGFLPKRTALKEFFVGGEKFKAEKLLNDILKYVTPEDQNIVRCLQHDVKEAKHKIVGESLQPTRPFHVNFISGLTDFPKLLIKWTKKAFGGKEVKENVKIAEEKADTRNRLLGLWANITKIAGDFDKGITGENGKDLKTILKKGIKGNEKALADFFEERKLKMLYSFKDGKASGLLVKSRSGENHLEEFAKEILSESSQSSKSSVLEKVKKDFVCETIDNKIISKQGSFLPAYGQSAASFIARVVSGTIPAWFIANDFYNLKIAHTDDKNQAKGEWSSKFKQETGRIGIDAYEGYVFNSIFERLTNKSLPFAVGLNIVNTVSSNVLSRWATNRPVLPVSVEKAEKLNHAKDKKAEQTANMEVKENVAVDDKLTQLNTYKSFKNNKQAVGFGAAPAKFMAKMPLKEFETAYEKVAKLDKKDAQKMLEIAAEFLGIVKDKEKLEIKDIVEKAKDTKQVVIGRNWVYRYSQNVKEIVIFPWEFTKLLGTSIINPVRKLFHKKPLKAGKDSEFYSEQFVKNVTKWADKVNNKLGTIDSKNLEEAQGRYAKNKNFFSTKIMEYGANQLSTAMKLTGFTTVPFLAVDAYNVTLGETKDKGSANTKMNQRAVQDSARQGVSLWISYAFNQMGKVISNANLAGNAIVIAVSAFSYESFTRLLVGQPLVPTSHEKMEEIDKNKSKNKNWFVKLMAGRLKTNNAASSISAPASSEKANKTVSQANNSNPSAPAFSLNSGNVNAFDVYKKLSNNAK